MLIAGLGNPGKRYAASRHNAGFIVIDRFAERLGVAVASDSNSFGSNSFNSGPFGGGPFKAKKRAKAVKGANDWRSRDGALFVRTTWLSTPTLLCKPQHYMNRSGEPIAAIMHFHKIPIERLIVVHDDIDIEFGYIKLKRGGGDGGHNGLRSISRVLGTGDYIRVRMGVGRPIAGDASEENPSGDEQVQQQGPRDIPDWVLSNFSLREQAELSAIADSCIDAIELLITAGISSAQNRYHGIDLRK